MTQLIRNWLMGIVCAAMAAALADGLMPAGAIRKIGRLTGGLVLLLAMVQPVLQIDSVQLDLSVEAYQNEWGGGTVDLERTNDDLMKTIIAERAGAYIQDKAVDLGFKCRAEVQVTQTEAADYPVPASVIVYGDLSRAQRCELTREIEDNLAIPAECQSYQAEDAE